MNQSAISGLNFFSVLIQEVAVSVRLIQHRRRHLVGLVEGLRELLGPAVQHALIVAHAPLVGGVFVHGNVIGAGELSLLGQELPGGLEGPADQGGVQDIDDLVNLLIVLVADEAAVLVPQGLQLIEVGVFVHIRVIGGEGGDLCGLRWIIGGGAFFIQILHAGGVSRIIGVRPRVVPLLRYRDVIR